MKRSQFINNVNDKTFFIQFHFIYKSNKSYKLCPGRMDETSRFEVAVAQALLGGLMQVIRLHLDSW